MLRLRRRKKLLDPVNGYRAPVVPKQSVPPNSKENCFSQKPTLGKNNRPRVSRPIERINFIKIYSIKD